MGERRVALTSLTCAGAAHHAGPSARPRLLGAPPNRPFDWASGKLWDEPKLARDVRDVAPPISAVRHQRAPARIDQTPTAINDE